MSTDKKELAEKIENTKMVIKLAGFWIEIYDIDADSPTTSVPLMILNELLCSDRIFIDNFHANMARFVFDAKFCIDNRTSADQLRTLVNKETERLSRYGRVE